MRAISLWEPWGTAIARGLKKIETRHWSTDYRGPLAIHCAKNLTTVNALWDGADDPEKTVMLEALERVGVHSPSDLAFGCIVAVCMLVKVVPVQCLSDRVADPSKPEHLRAFAHLPNGFLPRLERTFGNYETGRFAWMLDHVRPLATPQTVRGAQGFFTVPDGLLV